MCFYRGRVVLLLYYRPVRLVWLNGNLPCTLLCFTIYYFILIYILPTVLIIMSKGFRQGSCGHPLDDADGHDLCFECLGTGHAMADCQACLAYTIKMYNKRSMRLALWCCYREGAKPPAKHSLAHYTRQLAKFQHSTDPGSPANRSQPGDPESDREGSQDPPAIIPASGGLDGSVGRAAAVGAHPMDPPGVQRSSGVWVALWESTRDARVSCPRGSRVGPLQHTGLG